MPIRIQRRRIAGWRIPENAVFVGRPSRFWNPYDWKWARADAVRMFRDHVRELGAMVDQMRYFKMKGYSWDRYTTGSQWEDGTRERNVMIGIVAACEHGELKGKDLVCWCRIGKPCHADLLLRMANGLMRTV